ncbi:hypothetical protein Hs20B_06940 [Lactococcus insecticola]|uniref:Prepilin type IV endopeptidase peptidase domain-containing protein n=2 Tax=Pseudolactococcus insecticola TaxID=2709158 RepID=A0A6A0B5Q0_9LACT|nr:hypothetical protein Hs20B_06940 [Lactococcus insecticola]
MLGLSSTIDLTTFILLVVSSLLTGFDLKSHSFPLIIWLIFFGLLLVTTPFRLAVLFFLIAALLTELGLKKIGSGDWLYLSLLSFLIDLHQITLLLFIASLTGIVYYMLRKKKEEIPFLPFLSIGFISVLFII